MLATPGRSGTSHKRGVSKSNVEEANAFMKCAKRCSFLQVQLIGVRIFQSPRLDLGTTSNH
jgi:hypothetical protein